jgi:hypothetical protein
MLPIPILTNKDISRFWLKVEKRASHQCWLWKGYCLPAGYGAFSFANGQTAKEGWTTATAHSIACFLMHGPSPEGKPFALHNCDNPSCCNPKHLFWGSQSANIKQAYARGHRPALDNRGEKNGRAIFTEADIVAIRTSNKSLRQEATERGVSVATIAAIRQRRNWRHVP